MPKQRDFTPYSRLCQYFVMTGKGQSLAVEQEMSSGKEYFFPQGEVVGEKRRDGGFKTEGTASEQD